MYDIPFISMITIDRELPIIDVGQRHCGDEYRRYGERRRNTDAPIDDSVISNVDKGVSVVQVSTEAVALKGSGNVDESTIGSASD